MVLYSEYKKEYFGPTSKYDIYMKKKLQLDKMNSKKLYPSRWYHNILGIVMFTKLYFLPFLLVDQKTRKYLPQSNSFSRNNQTDIQCKINHNNQYESYSSLNYVYHKVLRKVEKNHQIEVTVTEPCFLMANAFCGKNVGHNMSHFHFFIHEYLKKKMTCPVYFTCCATATPRMLEYIGLFIDPEKFRFMEKDKVYKFSNIYVTESHHFSINKFPQLFQKSIQLSLARCTDQKYKNRTVFIVKNGDAKTAVDYNKYQCRDIKDYLEKKRNVVIIDPEKMKMVEIISYLSQASKIITSFGAILYVHQNFFNPQATVYFMRSQLSEYPYAGLHSNKHQYIIINCLEEIYSNKNLDLKKDLFLQKIKETNSGVTNSGVTNSSVKNSGVTNSGVNKSVENSFNKNFYQVGKKNDIMIKWSTRFETSEQLKKTKKFYDVLGMTIFPERKITSNIVISHKNRKYIAKSNFCLSNYMKNLKNRKQLESKTGIVSRLNYLYQILSSSQYIDENVNEKVFWMVNPYAGSNSVEEKNIYKWMVKAYLKEKLNCPIYVSPKFKNRKKWLSKKISQKIEFRTLYPNRIYRFKQLYVAYTKELIPPK